jgi:proteasome lid subunit RPN8/RPN11
MTKLVTKPVLKKFEKHVLASFPNEAVGFVVDGDYVSLTNTHPDPTEHFRLDPLEQAQHAEHATCLLHSHPYNKFKRFKYPVEWASQEDMEHWMAMNSMPWGIVSTDGEGISELFWLIDDREKPLLGREWIHATQDCYSLGRDWFWQERGIDLPNYARNLGWWNKPELGDGMLLDNFRRNGFRLITPDQLQVGDAVLMRYGTRVIGHCGVVTGENELLHHLWNKLSGHTTIGSVAKQITHYLRYDKEQT